MAISLMDNARLHHLFKSILLMAGMVFMPAPARAEIGVHWTQTSPAVPWSGNSSYRGSFVYQDRIWVSAAHTSDNNVFSFYSTADGIHFQIEVTSVTLPYNLSNILFFKGKLWGLASSNTTFPTTIFNSPDGKNWTTTATVAWNGSAWIPWTPFYTEPLFEHAGYLWSFHYPVSNLNMEIWRSTDAVHWYRVVKDPYWYDHTRPNSYRCISFAGKLWVFWNREVWNSSDGATWQAVTLTKPFGPQYHYSLAVYENKLWMIGENWEQGVWSSPDGKSWTGIANTLPWGQPQSITLAVCQGKLWNVNNRQTWWYTWLPGGPPVIEDGPGQVITEGAPYARRPLLLQASRPVTWSLVSAPARMTIDAATGAATWPFPVDSPTTYTIRIRSTNALGSDETSWPLRVMPHAPPVAQVQAATSLTRATVNWSPVPNINSYTIQRDDAANFASPLETLTVSSTTLTRTFTGLSTDKTYWYRVKGNKVIGTPGGWSNAVSSTHDTKGPGGWLTADNSGGKWPPVLTAQLFLCLADPGANPSGVERVRVSVDQKTWTPWQAYAPRMSFWIGREAGNVYAQACDRAGNIGDYVTTASVAKINAIYVNGSNTSGPWTGSINAPWRRIQEAINAAADGRVIVVAPGTYRENISFNGKNIVLRSADPQSPEIVKSTIIDGNWNGRTVTFGGTETERCELAGFTITHGWAKEYDDAFGGGIYGRGSSPGIRNNRIIENVAELHWIWQSGTRDGDYYYVSEHFKGYGGGIASCHGVIENNIIAFNAVCSGISFYKLSGYSPLDSSTPFFKPAFDSDYSLEVDAHGGALYDCNGVIRNNTIWGTDTGIGGGGWVIDSCRGKIQNNIIFNFFGSSIGNSNTPAHCCIEGWSSGGAGNISDNPLLANPWGGDFHLLAGSPCIDAGGWSNGLLRDWEGEARGLATTTTLRGDGSGFDIGADEYHPADAPLVMLEPHGGESMAAGALFRLQWLMDPARAGTKARLEVRRGNGAAVKAWSLDAPGGDGLAFKHLPEVSGPDFRLRVISESDPRIQTQSPPFAIWQKGAVGMGAWTGYR